MIPYSTVIQGNSNDNLQNLQLYSPILHGHPDQIRKSTFVFVNEQNSLEF